MTPEERAAAIVSHATRAICEDEEQLAALLAAAIREAVDAETEAQSLSVSSSPAKEGRPQAGEIAPGLAPGRPESTQQGHARHDGLSAHWHNPA